MNREEIKSAIEYFLAVTEGKVSSEERIPKLAFALDQLALAVHFADDTFDNRDLPDADVRPYSMVREIVSPNFPELGYYNVAMDISDKIAETSVGVGDAIDDICDITRDLEEVLWRWEHTSVDDALWSFNLGYTSH